VNTSLSNKGYDPSALVPDSRDSFAIDTPGTSSSQINSEVVDEENARPRDFSSSPPPRPAAPACISSKEPTPKKTYEALDHNRPIFDITSSSQAVQSLHMTFNYPSGHQGPFELKMDLATLLGLVTPGGPSSSRSIQPPYQQYASAMDTSQQQLTKGRQIVIQSPGKGFHSLPPELRNRVYRMLFVKNRPVQLHAGWNLSRSSQFLSYQRQVHQEGASILYGSNYFVFTRSAYRVGRWFASKISETGYSHIEKCLRTIGHHNISLMRDVTFVLTDASKATNPNLTNDQRRFVNDTTLHRCFRLLGKHGNLDTFTVDFQGKRMVMRSDIVFLDALTTIKAKEVHIKGSLDPKIEWEVDDFLTYPGKSEPLMRAWNKPWEKAFGPRCR